MRLKHDDDGFTLVELMVVVLIIAILIAIAIPTFLGARTRAQDRAAQSNLRNSLSAAKVIYSDSNADYNFGIPELDRVHAGLTYVAGLAPAAGQVGFIVAPNLDGSANQAVMFVALSQSGTWFCLWDEGSGTGAGTYFGQDSTMTFGTFADCQNGW